MHDDEFHDDASDDGVEALNLATVPPTRRESACVVEPREAGQRLDRWLAARFPYHGRGAWQQAVTAGEVRVNGQIVKAAHTLVAGERVVYLPPARPEPAVDTRVTVIHDDADLLALNKPANLPCHPGGPYFLHTLWGLWRDRVPEFRLLHRLDRETSGVVLVARTAAVAARLGRAFARANSPEGGEGGITKHYLVLVHGDAPDEMDARGWLMPHPASPVRKQRAFVPDPAVVIATAAEAAAASPDRRVDREAAHTTFRALHRANGFTLLLARPHTGRLHQIRATLCSLGWPVVGDKMYGLDPRYYLRMIDDALTAGDRASLVLDRQALHAWRLRLPGGDHDGVGTVAGAGSAHVLLAPPPLEIVELVGLTVEAAHALALDGVVHGASP